jgi:quercetin dioxygenase-like cupin family protein
MHYAGGVDWSFAQVPQPATPTVQGLSRSVLVGPKQGAVHTELAVGALQPGGWIQRHVHSFEEGLYVLEGALLLEIDGTVHALEGGDFALMPVGVWHTLGNPSDAPVRWLSVNTPQRIGPDAPRRDTYFAPGPMDLRALAARAARPAFGNPTLRLVGHDAGMAAQADALRVSDPARGRAPAGMDTAILAYSGISVKMLIDRGFGADLLTMFTVDYEPGGAAQAHDHPFEETYFFLAGEVEAELDDEHRVIGAGSVLFAGVGSVHGFYNTGSGRVRWIETQAPQPPARHAYRWIDSWRRFEAAVAGSSSGKEADSAD